MPANLYPRDEVLSRLTSDLVGPRAYDEILNARPSDVYATGILWPQNNNPDPDDDERLGLNGSNQDDGTPCDETEAIAASSLRRPSTAGISFATTSASQTEVTVVIEFGVYSKEASSLSEGWQRKPYSIKMDKLRLVAGTSIHKIDQSELPAGIYLHIRSLLIDRGLLTTFTLVNGSTPPAGRDQAESCTLFQTSIKVIPESDTQIIARPSRKAAVESEDVELAMLYRDVCEFAAGHTCSADWDDASEKIIIWTTWLPSIIVPAMSAEGHDIFRRLALDKPVFDASWLAEADRQDLTSALRAMTDAYEEWIDTQALKIAHLQSRFLKSAEENIFRCRNILRRLRESIQKISSDSILLQAFQLANKAMLIQYRWAQEKTNADAKLKWRPFQLAFLLLTMESAVNPNHKDREVMDLLWFPTGGGKTEAYLGLVALTAFYRRLVKGKNGAGVTAVMRYTLRLLTTQQFTRAAALILACETIRRKSKEFGQEPFSIGLWVGSDASPNTRKESFDKTRSGASAIQIEKCPACKNSLSWNQNSATSPVVVRCSNTDCDLNDENLNLPIWTVDEDIYAIRPTLLIGTIDKFAQIVRKPETNILFGINSSQTPDLIIQDELHLISGPLGTLAALYEAAFDLMLSHAGAKPKIIGSTATIRRAADQVRALFNRDLCQFPPSAIDHDDSGFAVINKNAAGRRYVGIASAGRSAKYTLQAVSASLLQTGKMGFTRLEEADPYSTLVAYFNSLRELGGSLVLMQDDVNDTLKSLATLRSETARTVENIEELTSRRSQDEIRTMLDTLAIPNSKKGSIDVVLATNMLSVGVDIPRLGLMLVYGQPKGIAEYIQATSRVGRGNIAGIVVSVLNSAKARDRSHFETFRTWHTTLYRDVEATSVTPFASRARDRALHAVLVALVRHTVPSMLTQPILDSDAEVAARTLIENITLRAKQIDPNETEVEAELLDYLAKWLTRNCSNYWNDYKPRDSLLQSAERAATEKALGRNVGEAWPTMNNMRSVETGTPFRLAEWLRPESD